MHFYSLLTEKRGGGNNGMLTWNRLAGFFEGIRVRRPVTLMKSLVIILLVSASWATPVLARSPLDQELSKAAGKVLGRVSLVGEYERLRPLKVFKNRDFCGSSVANETLLVDREGGLRNAVVTLTPLGQMPTAQPGKVVLDNKQCAFDPHVQVATRGSEVLLKNSDPILHTVHARLGKETLFNVGLPKWREVTKVLDRVGVVRIDCDVLHTWMSAAIIVVSTPYHAVTDETGRFSIDNLPSGVYEMEVWHERLGTKTGGISIGEDSAVSIDVVYTGY
jgi:plastocyanin